MVWCKIKRRKENAIWRGIDLGENPKIRVTVQREEDLRLPKPVMPLKIITR